jgi:hypothetical protein
LQVLRGQQAPALHFIATQKALFGCIHSLARLFELPERLQDSRKHFQCKLFFAESGVGPRPRQPERAKSYDSNEQEFLIVSARSGHIH